MLVSLPESDIKNLPPIVRREILSPKVNDKVLGFDQRRITIDKLISIYDINFKVLKNEFGETLLDKDGKIMTDQQLRVAEFADELKRHSLTYEEVIEAYRLAAGAYLTDDFGELIRFYPTLSTAQCSKILKAYAEMKLQDPKHTVGIDTIKKLIAKQKESDETEKKKIWKAEFLQVVKVVVEGKNTFNAINYWDYAISKGGMKEFILLSNDEKTEKITYKFKEIFQKEYEKENSYILTKAEKEYISDYLQSPDKGIDKRGADAYKRIEGMAIFQIKNQLVIDWILEEHRKKISK